MQQTEIDDLSTETALIFKQALLARVSSSLLVQKLGGVLDELLRTLVLFSHRTRFGDAHARVFGLFRLAVPRRAQKSGRDPILHRSLPLKVIRHLFVLVPHSKQPRVRPGVKLAIERIDSVEPRSERTTGDVLYQRVR